MARILFVDDDPETIAAGKQSLEKSDHQIELASNRLQGMEKVGTFKPDLLILSVMMEQPDDGFVMAQTLRRQGWTKPIMMLTKVGTVSGLQFGADAEMVPVDCFECKPVEPAVFVAKVTQLLKNTH